VQLKDFSFITPTVEAELVLRAIETVISPEIIVQNLAQTGSVEERKRKLPSQLTVCLVITQVASYQPPRILQAIGFATAPWAIAHNKMYGWATRNRYSSLIFIITIN
jgi:hypothetical protein